MVGAKYQLFQSKATGKYAWFKPGTGTRESIWYYTLDQALNWNGEERCQLVEVLQTTNPSNETC